MAIHAKKSGMMIGGKIIEEGDSFWCFHATDEKRPKYIQKSDAKNQVFDGDDAVENAMSWIESVRGKK